MSFSLSLSQLGWRTSFLQQLSLEELSSVLPARVMSVARNGLDTMTEQGALKVTLPSALTEGGHSDSVAVGDWVLVDALSARVTRVLERQSVIARLAAGDSTRRQLIAANIDTLFVITSCNDDFNASRLERYFALAF